MKNACVFMLPALSTLNNLIEERLFLGFSPDQPQLNTRTVV